MNQLSSSFHPRNKTNKYDYRD